MNLNNSLLIREASRKKIKKWRKMNRAEKNIVLLMIFFEEEKVISSTFNFLMTSKITQVE